MRSMTAVTFDTYKFIQHLCQSGFEEKQAVAEALGQAQSEADIATKSDLRKLRTELWAELKEMELRLILKMGAMIVAAVGIIVAVLRVPH